MPGISFLVDIATSSGVVAEAKLYVNFVIVSRAQIYHSDHNGSEMTAQRSQGHILILKRFTFLRSTFSQSWFGYKTDVKTKIRIACYPKSHRTRVFPVNTNKDRDFASN